eukprot:1158358-Pelagomonas_calceolata.AAC.3
MPSLEGADAPACSQRDTGKGSGEGTGRGPISQTSCLPDLLYSYMHPAAAHPPLLLHAPARRAQG